MVRDLLINNASAILQAPGSVILFPKRHSYKLKETILRDRSSFFNALFVFRASANLDAPLFPMEFAVWNYHNKEGSNYMRDSIKSVNYLT